MSRRDLTNDEYNARADRENSVVDNPNELEFLPATWINLCKDVGYKLSCKFPGWRWTIQPDPEGGMINIFTQAFMTDGYGVRIRVEEIVNDPSLAVVVEQAGQFLERFGLPRSRFKREYLRLLTYDLNGCAVIDITDRDGKERRRARDGIIDKAIRGGRLDIAVKDFKDKAGKIVRHLAVRTPGA